ncbi:PAS domain-containing response regulator [Pedosphaera parvula]|uniref:histidine kinase n=1 Tax=Pedosphaera parvula (strain Ellin514) TaxID=320771 RepID=B9XI95_PEDPL|nr:PAS domain S-box protein [Pedosphaera parvula]EEF60356.1 putative PAS/PAC sensor protein [Pedosphaera parvula Ellin514]
MKKPLRALIVEDSEDDTLLLVFELRRGGFEPQFHRVDNVVEMRSALSLQEWDVVLCDHVIPGFGSIEALRLISEKGLDIPLIIVSGAIGEETAVEAMKAGAQDYVLKHKLFRLVPAIEREVREALNRKERHKAEEMLAYMAAIVESSEDAIIGKTLEGIITSWNTGAEHIYGYTADEVKGHSVSRLIPPERPEELKEFYQRIKNGEHIDRYQTQRLRKDGAIIDVSLTLSAIKNGKGEVVGVSAIERDITRRKREEKERLRLIEELKEALTNIKTLKGLLPICASCKMIRDDRGYWERVETYISKHTQAEFTHGICPDCRERLYPEYTIRKGNTGAG